MAMLKRHFRGSTALFLMIVVGSVAFVMLPANADNSTANPVFTVGNTPLPVTGTVAIGNGPLAVTGNVSISNTPHVLVSKFQSAPYQFIVYGGFDDTGSYSTLSYTIPAGKTMEVQYVTCNANLVSTTNSPLRIELHARSTQPLFDLMDLQVRQLGGTYQQYHVSQPMHAYIGLSSGATSESTVTLQAYVFNNLKAIPGYIECYVAGELFW